MAGINRLGKGPAKPGTMRPQDPNKYKTMDIFSEGTEGDKDYARMVQDIEDTQQNHTGWLFGRGAFDKGDLLYLRDEEEKRRFAEQELRDNELRSFAKMRHRAEAVRDTGQLGSDTQAAKGKDIRSQTLQSLIRVKPAAKVRLKGQQASDGPQVKRLKAEVAASQSVNGVVVKSEPDVKEEESNGLADLLGGYGSDAEEQLEVKELALKVEPASKAPGLLLPDIKAKNEVKMEPLDRPPDILPVQPIKEEEEVDYSDDSSEEDDN